MTAESHADFHGVLEYSRKRFLYLEGEAYQRGYAEGRLRPSGVYRMTREFPQNTVFDFLAGVGTEVDLRANPFLWNLIWALLQTLVAANRDTIPLEFMEEMRGMCDACRELGYDVSMKDLLTLNAGFEVLQSVMVGFEAVFCNQFAVFGGGHAGWCGLPRARFHVPHRRGVFSDEAMLMVPRPTQGNPFIASAAPGMVGIPTGLNVQGVNCAVDVARSMLTRPLVTGEGRLLLCREVVKYAGYLQEGIGMIKQADRAVPRLYLLADGKAPDAALLEAAAGSLLPPEKNLNYYLSRPFEGLLGIFFPSPALDRGDPARIELVEAEQPGVPGIPHRPGGMDELAADPRCPELDMG